MSPTLYLIEGNGWPAILELALSMYINTVQG